MPLPPEPRLCPLQTHFGFHYSGFHCKIDAMKHICALATPDTCHSPMLTPLNGFSLPAVKCDAPTQPQNGSRKCANATTGEFTYKSLCAFQCNEGFELHGSAQLECTSQGEWSQGVPSCRGNAEFRLTRHTPT